MCNVKMCLLFFFFLLLPIFVYAEGDPYIEEIRPDIVTPGKTRVGLFGRDFGDEFYSGTLYINDIEISSADWSDTEVSFQVPSYLNYGGTIKIRSYDEKSGYTSYYYKRFYIKPEISSLSAYTGVAGDEVTIYGDYFDHVFGEHSETIFLQVYVGGIPCNNTNTVDWQNNFIKIRIPEGAKTGLIKLEFGSDFYDRVISVESSQTFNVLEGSANDTLSAYQTYLNQININEAWKYSKGGNDVVVAIIDDGVYINHPELQDNVWVNKNEIVGNNKDDDGNGYTDDRLGWDFVADISEMSTRGTHGTMVAGIIGAVSNNNVGITGINWYVKLMSLIACDSRDGCDDEDISEAIRYAADNGADIINLSLSTWMTIGYKERLDGAIKYAFDKNILIVAAAGNGDKEGGIGQNLDLIPQSPVCNDVGKNMVLGVGALDSDGYRTSWSNYGGCVDVYAPGENIVTTAVPAYSTFEGLYDFGDGTSFSAPIISGVAALVKAKYPSINNSLLRDRIIKFAKQGVIDANGLFAELGLQDRSNIDRSFVDREKGLVNKVDINLSNKLSGRILLQVEDHGEAWYVNPKDKKRYYMANGSEAYNIMRNLGVGITNSDLEKIKINKSFAKKHSGKIFLQVEDLGQAYYIDFNGTPHYLKDGPAAYTAMRVLGLGVSNNDLRKIEIN